jgi:hypothetical protein
MRFKRRISNLRGPIRFEPCVNMEGKLMTLIQRRITPAIQAASRSNGPKSPGPATEAAKINSSMNALKHGLRSRAPSRVLEALGEAPQDFQNLHQEFFQQFRPRTPLEGQLVEKIVENRWRDRRLRRAEESMLLANYGQFELDHAQRLAAEGRAEVSVGAAQAAHTAGLASLPDSDAKFALILQCLESARQAIETGGFGEDGRKPIEAVYGPDASLAGASLLAAYEECHKTASQDLASEEQRQRQHTAFLQLLDKEIGSFQILQEVHRRSRDDLTAARAGSLALLPNSELNRLVRYETFLDRQFEQLIRQLEKAQAARKNSQPLRDLSEFRKPDDTRKTGAPPERKPEAGGASGPPPGADS